MTVKELHEKYVRPILVASSKPQSRSSLKILHNSIQAYVTKLKEIENHDIVKKEKK